MIGTSIIRNTSNISIFNFTLSGSMVPSKTGHILSSTSYYSFKICLKQRQFNIMVSITFCSNIKSSLFWSLLGYWKSFNSENPGRVDAGINFERSSSQNMRTRLKFEQNTWTWLFLDKNTWTRLNFLFSTPTKQLLYFYRHFFSSILNLKSLWNSHRDAWCISPRFCQSSSLAVNLIPLPLTANNLNNRKIQIE